MNQPLDSGIASNVPEQRLQFTESVRADLIETSKWAMFFAVLLFIVLGFIAFGALFAMLSGPSGFFVGVVLLGLYGVLLFFPAWYYYKFASLTRQGVDFENNQILDEGFAYLRRFYNFVGILVIVLLSFYLLILVFGLFTAGNLFRNF
ncbi:MAG: hypothetical protein KIS77_06630 [Saprospiraceae bacterium]|nr:hypothetical protein [Saprospiraceae bacterium]